MSKVIMPRIAPISGKTANLFAVLVHTPTSELADRVRQGVAVRTLDDAAKFYDMPKSEILALVQVTPASESRWKKENKALPVAESDRVARIARVTAAAARLLGDEEQARAWLRRKVPALAGRTPLSCLDTDAGSRLVEETLERSIAGVLA